MTTREATCSCGQLRVSVAGELRRISVCHCLSCQQRTGSAFGYQARFDRETPRIAGRSTEYVRISDAGEERRFHFCPGCGTTVYYWDPSRPELIAVAVGAFADPEFPAPTVSVWEARQHDWVTLPPGAAHHS